MNTQTNSSFMQSSTKRRSRRTAVGVVSVAGVVATAGAIVLASSMSAAAADKTNAHPGGAAPALSGTISNLTTDTFTLTSKAPGGNGRTGSDSSEAAVTVTTNDSTNYFTATSGSVSDVKAGVCASTDATAKTVTAVTVSDAADGACTAMPAFLTDGPSGAQGAPPTGAPAKNGAKPAGGGAKSAAAATDAPTAGTATPSAPASEGSKPVQHKTLSGLVTKVSGSTVTVKTKTGSKTFSVSDSTKYRDVAVASRSAVTDGATAQVTSTASKQSKAKTSKVTAKTVTITLSDND